MRITWSIEGVGSGEAETETADGAAEALTAAVRAAYSDEGTSVVAYVLLNAVAPLRAQLVTDGRYAVEHGQRWQSIGGNIIVELSP